MQNNLENLLVDPVVVAKVTKEEKEELIKRASDKKMVRYLVDQYYQSQAYRITAQNQVRSLMQGYDESEKEHPLFISKELENAIKQEALNKKYMDVITDAIPVCKWMKSITGIGPVIAANLYSSFEMEEGRYNTDFLSYAGLNDNNNPWLGTEKANQLVKEAVAYREEKYNSITSLLTKRCANDKIEKKLFVQLKKLGKTDDFGVPGIDEIFKEVTGSSLSEMEDLDFSIIVDYVKWLAVPGRCDEILIQYCATATGRKPGNIRKGTINNLNNKKEKKGKYPTTTDLASYLAKPPYNKDLKKLMFIVGDMFIKNSGRDKSLYGKIYKQRKIEEHLANDAGKYAHQAAKILSMYNYDKKTPTYKSLSEGKLSDVHINARARRYAVKLFISHVYEAMYYDKFHKDAPQTYVIAHMGHHDYIGPEVDFKPFIDGE